MNRQTKEYLFPKAYDEYGSSMGRDEYGPSDNSKPYKLHLMLVPIDGQGYDPGGAYWGIGEPLYVAWKEDTAETIEEESSDICFFMRAGSREKAKEIVRKTYRNARFYR